MRKAEKRGQTAIYIIIAVVIIAAGILIYYFFPEVNSFLRGEIVVNNFLAERIESEIKSNLQELGLQGGYENPEGYILYQGKKVKYMCYTAHYFVPCGEKGSVQQPMPKARFEKELTQIMQPKVEQYMSELRQEYLRRGYKIKNVEEVKVDVKIIPEKITAAINAPMTVEKDTITTFNNFEIETSSKMYDLVMIATSVIDYEATYGDSSTDLYIQYYPNLRIEKTKLEDGSKIYTLTDVTTNERFRFASRSLVFAPGYGLE